MSYNERRQEARRNARLEMRRAPLRKLLAGDRERFKAAWWNLIESWFGEYRGHWRKQAHRDECSLGYFGEERGSRNGEREYCAESMITRAKEELAALGISDNDPISVETLEAIEHYASTISADVMDRRLTKLVKNYERSTVSKPDMDSWKVSAAVFGKLA